MIFSLYHMPDGSKLPWHSTDFASWSEQRSQTRGNVEQQYIIVHNKTVRGLLVLFVICYG